MTTQTLIAASRQSLRALAIEALAGEALVGVDIDDPDLIYEMDYQIESEWRLSLRYALEAVADDIDPDAETDRDALAAIIGEAHDAIWPAWRDLQHEILGI